MNQFAKPGLAEEKLPPVGTSDNGKVLGVSDGAWDKIAAPSGLPEIGAGDTGKVLTATADGAAWQSGGSSGGGVLVVNATTQDEGETYTLDQTWQAIHDADLAVIHGLAASAGEKSWAIVGSTDSLDHSLLATQISMLDPYRFMASSASDYPVGGFYG